MLKMFPARRALRGRVRGPAVNRTASTDAHSSANGLNGRAHRRKVGSESLAWHVLRFPYNRDDGDSARSSDGSARAMTERPPLGPEIRDLPVTVLFTPYTPERRVGFGAGSLIEQGCGHRSDTLCKNRPEFLLYTNVAGMGACSDHLREIVAALIAEAQERGGDHNEQPGFLHRVATPKRRPAPLPRVEYDPNSIVYETSIDGRFELRVYRSTKHTRIGVLVVAEADRPPLFERTVYLAFGAAFGPDSEDVEEWLEMATEAIDEGKPTHQVIDEALERYHRVQRKLYRLLRTSVDVQLVFKKALEAFANADNTLRWMLQPNAVFQGRTPIESINGDTLQRVLELISGIRSWDLRMAAHPSQRPDDV